MLGALAKHLLFMTSQAYVAIQINRTPISLYEPSTVLYFVNIFRIGSYFCHVVNYLFRNCI